MSGQAEQLQQTMAFFKLAVHGRVAVVSRPEPKREALKRAMPASRRASQGMKPASAMSLASAGTEPVDESQFARY